MLSARRDSIGSATSVAGAPAALNVAFVLWDGQVGGAERLAADLSRELRAHDWDARIIFVRTAGPLGEQLDDLDVPYRSLGLARGSHVLGHARTFARLVQREGPDAAVLPSFGYLGAALRVGGYRAPIVGVEHGVLHQIPAMRRSRRVARHVDRLSGVLVHDAEVAVSRYMRSLAEHRPHGRRLVTIPNGVDLQRFSTSPPPPRDPFVVGFAGRLVAGKGVDVALETLAGLPERVVLAIAGDGPLRQSLQARADALGIARRVRFHGFLTDTSAFWRACHVAVAPSDSLSESFGLVVAEALACGRPVIASRKGALPELIDDGVTGTLVTPGDEQALRTAIHEYLLRPGLLERHSAGACAVRNRLGIDACAMSYAQLITAIRSGRDVPHGRRGAAHRAVATSWAR